MAPPTTAPSLTGSPAGGRPAGVVLMLHGGEPEGLDAVGSRSTAWWRARLMMRQLQGAFSGAGVDVWLLRHRLTGWNAGVDGGPSPVADARWALDEVRSRHGALPVVLIGHSMGGRTAVAVADDRDVVGVVALAPWVPPGEPVVPLRGKQLVAAHGRRDKVCSFAETADFVRRAQGVASRAELVDMGGLDHYLIRGIGAWNAVARERSLTMLGV